jgi:hypothetical protein
MLGAVLIAVCVLSRNHGLAISEHDLSTYLHTLPSIMNSTVLGLRESMVRSVAQLLLLYIASTR